MCSKNCICDGGRTYILLVQIQLWSCEIILVKFVSLWIVIVLFVQVRNPCQKLLFLHQLTHNMTTDCSLNYHFSAWKFQAQNMGKTWGEHVVQTNCLLFLFWHSEQLMCTTCSTHILPMFSPCSELGIYMYLTGNSINNLLSYCVKASDIDLPV